MKLISIVLAFIGGYFFGSSAQTLANILSGNASRASSTTEDIKIDYFIWMVFGMVLVAFGIMLAKSVDNMSRSAARAFFYVASFMVVTLALWNLFIQERQVFITRIFLGDDSGKTTSNIIPLLIEFVFQCYFLYLLWSWKSNVAEAKANAVMTAVVADPASVEPQTLRGGAKPALSSAHPKYTGYN